MSTTTDTTLPSATGRAALSLLLGTVLLIVYGSLFPFDFVAESREASSTALSITFRRTTRGDIVANLLLYMPLGFALALAAVRRAWLVRVLLAVVVGVALSVAIELAQLYTPARVTSLTDVFLNAVGALVGAVLGGFQPHLAARFAALGVGRGPVDGVALTVVGLWACNRLAPFVPTIDWQKYKDAVKPLLLDPQITALGLLHYAAAWLVVAHALRCSRAAARPWLALLGVAAIVLAGRVIVEDNALSASEVVALVLCLPLAAVVGRLGERRASLTLFALAAVAVALDALAPFALSDARQAFGWVPFRSSITSNWESAYTVLFEKAFWCCALLWLLLRARWRLPAAAAATAGLLLALEIAQMWLPGRYPETTDPVLALAVALAIGLTTGRAAVRAELNPRATTVPARWPEPAAPVRRSPR